MLFMQNNNLKLNKFPEYIINKTIYCLDYFLTVKVNCRHFQYPSIAVCFSWLMAAIYLLQTLASSFFNQRPLIPKIDLSRPRTGFQTLSGLVRRYIPCSLLDILKKTLFLFPQPLSKKNISPLIQPYYFPWMSA